LPQYNQAVSRQIVRLATLLAAELFDTDWALFGRINWQGKSWIRHHLLKTYSAKQFSRDNISWRYDSAGTYRSTDFRPCAAVMAGETTIATTNSYHCWCARIAIRYDIF
jgi:hypothetical protein